MEKNQYDIGVRTMIYDKPLFNYLLSYFLLVGIRKIVIVCKGTDAEYIGRTLGNGSEYGIQIIVVTEGIKASIEKLSVSENSRHIADNIMMVYGRCIFYSVDQTRFFQKAMVNRERFTMLVLPKKMIRGSSPVVIDQDRKVLNSNADELLKTQYDFSDFPILFFLASLLSIMDEERDIATFIYRYVIDHALYVYMLDRGFVEIEVND